MSLAISGGGIASAKSARRGLEERRVEMENYAKQGSTEWHRERLGKVTGSQLAKVMKKGRKSDWSAAGETYMRQLIAERLTRKPTDAGSNKYFDWGHDHEPVAKMLYQFLDGTPAVSDCGFIRHPEIAGFGSSPDGLVGEDGCLEIKCPFTPAVHAQNLEADTIWNSDYEWQVQAHMAVTGRAWCDFVSFHPDFPEELKLRAIRVERCADMQDDIINLVARFADQIDVRVKNITEKGIEVVEQLSK